jgi:hypothetical protein
MHVTIFVLPAGPRPLGPLISPIFLFLRPPPRCGFLAFTHRITPSNLLFLKSQTVIEERLLAPWQHLEQ